MNGGAPWLVLWLAATSACVAIATIRYRQAQQRLATLGPADALPRISPQRNFLAEIIASIAAGEAIAFLPSEIWPQMAAPEWVSNAALPFGLGSLAAFFLLKGVSGGDNGQVGSRALGFFYAAVLVLWLAHLRPYGWSAMLLIPLTAIVGMIRPRALTGAPEDAGQSEILSQIPNFTVRLLCGVVLAFSLIVTLVWWMK